MIPSGILSLFTLHLFKNMKISLFGNQDLDFDNLPHRLQSGLEQAFPNLSFIEEDPHELDLPIRDQNWIIIDTVRGLSRVTMLSVDDIAKPNTRVTAHDFDLTAFLLFAKKLDPALSVRIIGIPMGYDEQKALEETIFLLKSFV